MLINNKYYPLLNQNNSDNLSELERKEFSYTENIDEILYSDKSHNDERITELEEFNFENNLYISLKNYIILFFKKLISIVINLWMIFC